MKYTAGPTGDRAEIIIGIPYQCKNIAVALSGGADSALMLYLLAKEIRVTSKQCTLTPFTVPRPDGGANYSPKIVEYINNKLGISIAMPIIVGDGNVDHATVISVANKGLLDSGKYDLIFVAENKVPPIYTGAMPPVRSPSKNAWKRLALPFFNVQKHHLIDLYYQEGIEEMLNYSHSCTGLTSGRCNVCFNCQERAWAFSTLDKTDPGSA